MERVAADIEGIHLGIADLDALLVGAFVENAFDLQSRLGRGCRNQFDDGGATLQWPASVSGSWPGWRRATSYVYLLPDIPVNFVQTCAINCP
jgi:hypothetical protein